MTDRTTPDGHRVARVGATTRSLDAAPEVGTWKLERHGRCEGSGRLMALTPSEPAPLCPMCLQEVRWTLTHLAPAVAVDHGPADRIA